MSLLLSIAVLASFALIAGGIITLRRRGPNRRRGWLMVAAGAVTLLNVALWSTMPGQR